MHRRSSFHWLPVLLLVSLGFGCATPSTKQVDLAPELVNLEKARQRQLALEAQHRHQKRLSDLAYPLLTGAVSLCDEDVAPLLGMHFRNAHYWEDEEWQKAARGALGVGDSVQIVAVAEGSPAAEAGLQPGDVLLQVGDHEVGVGEKALEDLAQWVEEFRQASPGRLTVKIRRGDTQKEVHLSEIPTACNYPATVVADNTLNAFANGDAIFVTTGMMRFAEDDELKVVLAHELAHNSMGHIDAKRQNALVGGILGALADVAVAAAGGTPTSYASQGAQAGAQAFNQDFEREADYVGLYAMALAGWEYEEASEFWRHMAAANPGSIALASTHPTSAERFIRLEYTARELDSKQARGAPLRPDPEDSKAKTYRGPDGASLTFQEGDYHHPDKSLDAFDEDREVCADRLLDQATEGRQGRNALTAGALHRCLVNDLGWQPVDATGSM